MNPFQSKQRVSKSQKIIDKYLLNMEKEKTPMSTLRNEKNGNNNINDEDFGGFCPQARKKNEVLIILPPTGQSLVPNDQ